MIPWTSRSRRAKKSASRSTSETKFRPALEQLEDRRVPAFFTVSTVADLYAAVTAANNLGAGTFSTINIAPGHYVLNAGELAISSNIAFNGTGTAPGQVIVDGGGASRDFDITSNGLTDSWQNLTITGGNASGSGGGVHALADTLSFNSAVVSANTATRSGGGIYLGNFGATASLTVDLSSITNNTCALDGGGVQALMTAGITSVQITRTTLSNNHTTGTAGGGVSLAGVSGTYRADIQQDTISSNTAGIGGGGLYEGLSNSVGNVILCNDTISNNTAGFLGGGIDFTSPVIPTYAVNLTVASNHCNTAGNGGGLDSAASGTVDLGNSIIVSNTSGAAFTPDDAKGTFAFFTVGPFKVTGGGPNLVTSLASVAGSNFMADPILYTGNPRLGPLQNNPCTYAPPTATQAITGSSLAAFKGSVALDNAFYFVGALDDQRGIPRMPPHPGKVDLGAYD